MPDEVYTKLPSTVLAYKKAHQIGRFDPAAPENQEKKISAMWKEIDERGSFSAWPTILLAHSGLSLTFRERRRKRKKKIKSNQTIPNPKITLPSLSLVYLLIPWMYSYNHWNSCPPRWRPPRHRPLRWRCSRAGPRPLGRAWIGRTQRQEWRQRQGRDAVFPMRAGPRGNCAGESSGGWKFWQSGWGRALGEWYGGDLRRNWCELFYIWGFGRWGGFFFLPFFLFLSHALYI